MLNLISSNTMFVLVRHGERQLQSPIWKVWRDTYPPWHIYFSPTMFSCGFELAPSTLFLEPLWKCWTLTRRNQRFLAAAMRQTWLKMRTKTMWNVILHYSSQNQLYIPVAKLRERERVLWHSTAAMWIKS